MKISDLNERVYRGKPGWNPEYRHLPYPKNAQKSWDDHWKIPLSEQHPMTAYFIETMWLVDGNYKTRTTIKEINAEKRYISATIDVSRAKETTRVWDMIDMVAGSETPKGGGSKKPNTRAYVIKAHQIRPLGWRIWGIPSGENEVLCHILGIERVYTRVDYSKLTVTPPGNDFHHIAARMNLKLAETGF